MVDIIQKYLPFVNDKFKKKYERFKYMFLEELIDKTGLTRADLARIWGVSIQAVSKRLHSPKPSEVKVSELLKVEKEINKVLIEEHIKACPVCENAHEQIEIKYYSNPNLQTNIKTPAITSVWFDRELVENIWHKDPANLRATIMPGDKMDSGDYPFKKDDILVMDISDTDVTKSGVYAFTTHKDTYFFINGVNRRYDGTYRFYFYNQNYPEKILTEEEVKTADIKIVGRIVKNLSLTI